MEDQTKTALITGASSGIGKATARLFLEAGYAVYGAARRVEAMADLEGLGVAVLRMDVTREEDRVAVVQRIADEHGGVDVLVNNAGFGTYGAVEDISLDDARDQFEVNLFGLARLTQLVLPSMRERRAGVIVNVSSVGGKVYMPLGAWYHASKHALEGWSDCLRLELKTFGIGVIIIEPGIIRTGFGEVMRQPMLMHSGEGVYRDLARRMARAVERTYREGEGSAPEVVARTILRAVRSPRPRTRYVTGKHARSLMAARRWLGDRMFDWIIMKRMS